MPRIARLLILLLAFALLSAKTGHAQLPPDKGSYAQLLAKYDKNHNGLLDDQERNALLAPAEAEPPPSMPELPLICDGHPVGNAGESTDSSAQRVLTLNRGPRHIQLSGQRFAENPPEGDNRSTQANHPRRFLHIENSTEGYPAETSPDSPDPQPRATALRNVVRYRMLLNESRAQERSRSFAQAATFGPMLGRTKQQIQAVRAETYRVRFRATTCR